MKPKFKSGDKVKICNKTSMFFDQSGVVVTRDEGATSGYRRGYNVKLGGNKFDYYFTENELVKIGGSPKDKA